jgi:SAM-dependent methyltransferase
MTPESLSASTAPRPPLELANRVGTIQERPDPWGHYDFIGARTREEILSRLPGAWTFEGKQVLDFGCGAGRTLRHFLSEANDGELWGCDIDGPSIGWMQRELCPPLHVVQNGPEPPLPFEDRKFDLIWAVSVFTHLADTWSAWMVELHRILKHDGILLATFMGPGMTELIAGEPWQEDRFGMNVLRYGEPWDLGGPMVLHAPWWINAHWGRAFEIIRLDSEGFIAQEDYCGHGVVVMRKKGTAPSIAELEAIEPDDPREALALAHAVRQQRREIAGLHERLSHDRAPASTAAVTERDDRIVAQQLRMSAAPPSTDVGQDVRIVELEDQVRNLARQLEVMATSKSWRLTRPLRTAARQVLGARREA